MTFTPKTWVNGTLVDAAAMTDLETRLSAYTDLDTVPNSYKPSDHSVISWAYDPSIMLNTTILAAAGTINTVRLKLRSSATITNVIVYITLAGGTLTSGQCFAGLYQGGTLIGTSADQATNWQSSGPKVMALTGGPFALSAGDLIVAFFANGTTLPTLGRSAFLGSGNLNMSLANSRYGTADTGRTTSLPATLGTITAQSANYWAAVS